MKKFNKKRYIVMFAVLFTLLVHCNVNAEIYTPLPCVIKEQPVNILGNIGDTVNFTVDATNVKVYRWEYCSEGQSTWQELGQSFTGYNSDTLTISLTNNYRLTNSYRCKLVGTDGNVKYTDTVKIEKAKPAMIISQPVNTVGKIGDTVKFTVKASSVKNYRWEYCSEGKSTWQELGQSFQGYNSDTLTISLTNNYRLTNSYRCKLVGTDGNVKYTDTVKIEKAKPAMIISQPVNTVGKIGDTVKFTVKASSVKNYRWEYCSEGQSTWQELGQSFSGYNSDTLTISLINNYRLTNSYRCKLVGTDGNVKYTDIVKIEKTKPATITSQPVDTVGKIGDTVKFTVKALSVKNYRWEYCSEGQSTWQELGQSFPGYDSDTLTISLTNNYRLTNKYRCKLIGYDGKILYSSCCGIYKIDMEEWETPIM